MEIERREKLLSASWRCKSCRGDEHRKRLIAFLYHSILRSNRMIYLSLDMSWMDKILRDDSQVMVFVNGAAKMGRLSAEALTGRHVSLNGSDIYQILAFEKLRSNESKEQTGQNFDAFLVQNPCWVPIHEPGLGSKKRPNTMADHLYAAVRLPSLGYGATCRLYTVLNLRQFPRVCRYDEAHMSVYQLANIGYGHIIRHAINGFVMGTMMKDFHKARVFSMPSTEVYMSRTVSAAEPRSGLPVTVNQGWSWADPATCPHEVFLHNPWACNFLKITNCTNRFLSAHIKPVEAPFWWSTPKTFMDTDIAHGGAEVSGVYRRQMKEVPWMSDAHWMASRIGAFLQRPNFRLRDELRKKMDAITNVRKLVDDVAVGREQELGGLRPCLAMHIRHSDASLDSRSQTRIDRSLRAHVMQSMYVIKQFNISNIFLATDNATVVEVVAAEFPQFNWLVSCQYLWSK